MVGPGTLAQILHDLEQVLPRRWAGPILVLSWGGSGRRHRAFCRPIHLRNAYYQAGKPPKTPPGLNA